MQNNTSALIVVLAIIVMLMIESYEIWHVGRRIDALEDAVIYIVANGDEPSAKA